MFTKDKRPQRADQPKSSLKNRFVAVNQDKLRRLRDNLTTRQRDLVDVLPLLFQTNQRRLPGYVSKDTPVGICDYVPTRQALQAAQRLALQYREEQPAQKLPAIKGLYLMGSPGTVGYSKTSDLDIWLVHDPALEDTDISTLKAKARKIETHASNIGLEMHFFVFDAVRFRSGETLSLSGESSGSSQHYLLLDEFYRSGLVLAGLKPLWWCVPASEEHRYGQYTQEALETNQLVEQDYVDFGGLANIPADEFLGATVWHLYKSIDSPYKSVLKLLLVETYASDYPAGQLLSHRYKKAIAEGEVSLTDLDPYILMYRRVEEYLQGKGDSARLDLIRRSFYIKTNVQLSKAKESRVPDWQRETLSEMALSWDWNKADIHHLDNRRDWKIPFALKERRILIKALQKSYTALSDFARSHGQDQKITEADLNVLGRKLYAAFEKKPSKIDIITRGICPNPTEDNLSLHCITEPSGRQRWSLYSGSVTPTEAKKTKPLLRARALAELLAWCHFNHLVDNNTHWRIYDQKQRLSIIDLRKAIDTINGVYPGGEIKAARSAALGTTPRPLAALLLINIGVDPLAGKVHSGGVLTSNKADPFQFGGQSINLVRSVDLLTMTSWEEVFALYFEGPNALIDAVMEYLQWATPLGSFAPPHFKVCCLSQDYGHAISERVESYANKLVDTLSGGVENVDRQLIVQIEKRYCRAYAKKDKPLYELHRNYAELLRALGNPRGVFNEVEFDAGCRSVEVLKRIFKKNKQGVIQVFVLAREAEADVYCLDEYGALFTNRQECFRIENIFDHYLRFLHNLLKNQPQSVAIEGQELTAGLVELYRLEPCPDDTFLVSKIPAKLYRPSDYLSVRVFVDVDNTGKKQFTIFCEEEEFSSAEHGGRLFLEIAAFILAKRGSSEAYPIYITDLELSHRFKSRRGIDTQQAIHLMNYKKRIEYQMTRALRDQSPRTAPMVATM